MSAISKFEQFIARLVEGSFTRLLPSKLQPVELRKKLERAMDNNQLVDASGRKLAPNIYEVFLSQVDFAEFAPFKNSLEEEMRTFLISHARQRRYRLMTKPMVIVQNEESLPTGEVRINARVMDVGAAPQGSSIAQTFAAAGIEETRAMSVVNLGSPAPTSSRPPSTTAIPSATLTVSGGRAGVQTYLLDREVTNIGRSLTNEIIIEEKKVSRNHAQIRYTGQHFVIFDLGSTNGISVRGRRANEHILQNNDVVTIGSIKLHFRIN